MMYDTLPFQASGTCRGGYCCAPGPTTNTSGSTFCAECAVNGTCKQCLDGYSTTSQTMCARMCDSTDVTGKNARVFKMTPDGTVRSETWYPPAEAMQGYEDCERKKKVLTSVCRNGEFTAWSEAGCHGPSPPALLTNPTHTLAGKTLTMLSTFPGYTNT